MGVAPSSDTELLADAEVTGAGGGVCADAAEDGDAETTCTIGLLVPVAPPLQPAIVNPSMKIEHIRRKEFFVVNGFVIFE